MEDNDVEMEDLGTAVVGIYETQAINFDGHTVRGGSKPLSRDDVMTLHDVAVVYQDRGAWVPVVEVSIDGITYTDITDGITVGTGDGRFKQVAYTTEISAPWFKLRIRGSGMHLSGMRLEFTHAGNVRND
jgi:hypothetical protein